jgi:hypothetical protein
MTTDRKKGHFTFRTAAVLLIASAVLELLSITSEELLFGAIRGGMVVAVYHLAYAALFGALGIGLWTAAKWAYTLVFVTTVVYTLDMMQLVLGREALREYFGLQLSALGDQTALQGMDDAMIIQAVIIMIVVIVLCWWGFALYTWWRRDYFRDDG